MSLVGRQMIHRAQVERNTAVADDWGGQSDPDSYTVVSAAQKCFILVKVKRQVVDDKVAQVEEVVGVFPAGADIKMGDRITSVVDRRGTTVLSDTLEIEAVSQRSLGPGVDHLSVLLRRHGN